MVEDGNDLKAIEKAISDAQKIKDKPKLIRVKTIIGFGMPKAGNEQSALGRTRRRSRQRNETQSRLGRKQKFLHSERSVESFPRSRQTRRERRKRLGRARQKIRERHTAISGKNLQETRSNKLPDRLGKIPAEIR